MQEQVQLLSFCETESWQSCRRVPGTAPPRLGEEIKGGPFLRSRDVESLRWLNLCLKGNSSISVTSCSLETACDTLKIPAVSCGPHQLLFEKAPADKIVLSMKRYSREEEGKRTTRNAE